MAVLADEIDYNPFDPSFLADPYRHYAPLLTGPPRRVTMGLPCSSGGENLHRACLI